MVKAAVLSAALLWQLAGMPSAGPQSQPGTSKYRRTVSVGAAGQACAVLDAAVYEHAAKASLDDLRMYAQSPSETPTEVPFVLTESGTAQDDYPATILHASMVKGDITFDLAMPSRPYTAVVLQLDAKDFVATAKVFGSDGRGGGGTPLGTFVLFDFSADHLPRSTTLPLQESSFTQLHVVLHMSSTHHGPPQSFDAQVIKGATVPPSREAQTLFTTVAETRSPAIKASAAPVQVPVPAHVPVERVSFEFKPGFTGNFQRSVRITGRPEDVHEAAMVDTVTGDIWSMKQKGDGVEGNVEGGIDTRKLSIDGTLGSTLHEAATVDIDVQNGAQEPLPIAAVRLEMRQRRICFDAVPGTAYTLFYGDAALHAPSYSRLELTIQNPATALLGSEERNPSFTPRPQFRSYRQRHPRLLWIALLAILTAFGSFALRSAKRQRHLRVVE